MSGYARFLILSLWLTLLLASNFINIYETYSMEHTGYGACLTTLFN